MPMAIAAVVIAEMSSGVPRQPIRPKLASITAKSGVTTNRPPTSERSMMAPSPNTTTAICAMLRSLSSTMTSLRAMSCGRLPPICTLTPGGKCSSMMARARLAITSALVVLSFLT